MTAAVLGKPPDSSSSSPPPPPPPPPLLLLLSDLLLLGLAAVAVVVTVVMVMDPGAVDNWFVGVVVLVTGYPTVDSLYFRTMAPGDRLLATTS